MNTMQPGNAPTHATRRVATPFGRGTTGPTAAGIAQVGSGQTGSGQVGSVQTEATQVGIGQAEAGQVRTSHTGSGRIGAAPTRTTRTGRATAHDSPRRSRHTGTPHRGGRTTTPGAAPGESRRPPNGADRSRPGEPAPPTDPRRALGRYGEDLATRRLIAAGMRILDRNWRCRDGEIDIIAADADALVICEVKTRRATTYEHPLAAVRPEKTQRLRLLAERWLERHGGPPPGGVRIDVIGVLLPARGAPRVEHVRGVA